MVNRAVNNIYKVIFSFFYDFLLLIYESINLTNKYLIYYKKYANTQLLVLFIVYIIRYFYYLELLSFIEDSSCNEIYGNCNFFLMQLLDNIIYVAILYILTNKIINNNIVTINYNNFSLTFAITIILTIFLDILMDITKIYQVYNFTVTLLFYIFYLLLINYIIVKSIREIKFKNTFLNYRIIYLFLAEYLFGDISSYYIEKYYEYGIDERIYYFHYYIIYFYFIFASMILKVIYFKKFILRD
jgi:hypothetical protein